MENLKSNITLFSLKGVISMMRYETNSLFGMEFRCFRISMLNLSRAIGHFQLNYHISTAIKGWSCRVICWKNSGYCLLDNLTK